MARPRQPFGLYTQRGSGQLLFDIGVSGDFVGSFTSNGVQRSNTCTFPGGCNRVFPRTAEIDLFGQIDPYARAMVIFSAGEEFESGSGDLNARLEEAYLSLLTLPFGTQAKMGKMLVRFGLLNPVHEHDQPQTDRPDVLTQFFGPEALNESGGEVTGAAPLPFFLEAVAGIFNGQNETAFGSNSFRLPLVTARLLDFFDFAELGALQLGVSAAFGSTADEARSWIWGADVKYKLTPEGWQWPLLTVGAEALVAAEPVQRHGFYAYAEVQPSRRWLAGARYDWTQYLSADGHQWGVEPYLAFAPSEFLRFRLGYKYTDRGSVRVALDPLRLPQDRQRGVPPGHVLPGGAPDALASEAGAPHGGRSACLARRRPRRRSWPGAGGAESAERLRVVATIPDLKALTEEVGGKLVEVQMPWCAAPRIPTTSKRARVSW